MQKLNVCNVSQRTLKSIQSQNVPEQFVHFCTIQERMPHLKLRRATVVGSEHVTVNTLIANTLIMN